MTFRATNAITSDAYIRLKRTATTLKQNVDTRIMELQTTDTDYGRLEAIYVLLVNASNAMDPLAATAGLSAYAADQEDDPAYDFDAEYAAMDAAIDGAAQWISQGIPVNNRTLKPIEQWSGAETIVQDTFTPTQMSGLVAQLQAVTDTIS